MISSSAARWTVDGKTSFDDCPMFTSSFGWTSSPASVAMTSFAFMFEHVPEPVWKTSIGNWSSSSPAAIRSPAAAIRSALSASSRPSSAFTRAAAALIRPSQRATGAGIGSPETGKLAIALVVSPPQSCCSSTRATLRVYPRTPTAQRAGAGRRPAAREAAAAFAPRAPRSRPSRRSGTAGTRPGPTDARPRGRHAGIRSSDTRPGEGESPRPYHRRPGPRDDPRTRDARRSRAPSVTFSWRGLTPLPNRHEPSTAWRAAGMRGPGTA